MMLPRTQKTITLQTGIQLMTTHAHVLVVDDEPDICTLVKEILEDEGYRVSVAENAQTARRLRQERPPDLVLLDIWMPDTDGISLLKEWQESGLLDFPVVMMSGHGTVETAVEATRLGAYDFIEKPVSLSKLLLTVERALEVVGLKKEQSHPKIDPVIEPLGHSNVMHELRERVKRMSHHDTPVLISGESGSGRTLFARYLHKHSPRGQKPFATVRVAGTTMESQVSQLFGNLTDGAEAKLAQANGGTLYLKDVADLDTSVQARLLNALENKHFIYEYNDISQRRPDPVSLDVRIISATSFNITHALNTGRLREDLYYHLNVVPLSIPPLRDHCEDVPELLEYYVNLFVSLDNLPYRRFTVAAQNRLRNYHWPGNVRELRNLVQRLLILGDKIEIEPDEIEPTLNIQQRPLSGMGNLPIFDLPLREAREQFERAYLEYQLQEVGGNVSKVASRVGLERTHLYRKLRSLEIDPKLTKK